MSEGRSIRKQEDTRLRFQLVAAPLQRPNLGLPLGEQRPDLAHLCVALRSFGRERESGYLVRHGKHVRRVGGQLLGRP